jgi:hypothetical protein
MKNEVASEYDDYFELVPRYPDNRDLAMAYALVKKANVGNDALDFIDPLNIQHQGAFCIIVGNRHEE